MVEEIKGKGEENLVQPATPMDVFKYAGGEDPRLPFGAILKGPLNGFVIISMEGVVALPTATDKLVGLGATVIKLENDDGLGDSARKWGGGDDKISGFALYFQNHSTGKLSITLNLGRDLEGKPLNPEHMQVAHNLLASADAFVENNKPGVIKKTIGYSPEEMLVAFPGLVVGSISGQGQWGPEAKLGSYATIKGGEIGEYDAGNPKGNPMMGPYSQADMYAGADLDIGLLAALLFRERKGKGSTVDIAMTRSGAEMNWFQHAQQSNDGKITYPLGDMHSSNAPLGIYKAGDKFITIAAANPNQWKQLCKALDQPEWIDNEKFKDAKTRFANRIELRDLINDVLATNTAAYWLDKFSKWKDPETGKTAGIPAGPVRTIDEVQKEDPTIIAQSGIIPIQGGYAKRVNHGIMGSEVGRIKEAPAAPMLGEHNGVIRDKLNSGEGLGSDFHAERIRKSKVVGVAIGDTPAPDRGVIEVVGSIQEGLTGKPETPTIITDPSILRALQNIQPKGRR